MPGHIGKLCAICNLQNAMMEKVVTAICPPGRFIKEITEDMWGNCSLGH